MASSRLVLRDISADVTTFSVPFNRFAPFCFRKFNAVGNRMTAIRLHDNKILLLNPVALEPSIKVTLTSMGGVDYVAADLGHHMYVKDYLDMWPDAKAIGVPGLQQKRGDVHWDFICGDWTRGGPEDEFGFTQDFETVMFEGFITYCVAWYHKPTKTLIQSDLLMNMPCYEQYAPSSSHQGMLSHAFGSRANPWSTWMRCLIYYVANVDYSLIRRDAKRVAEWEIERIIPCHGDVIDSGGNEAWESVYRWYLQGSAKPSVWNRARRPFMRLMRWLFLS